MRIRETLVTLGLLALGLLVGLAFLVVASDVSRPVLPLLTQAAPTPAPVQETPAGVTVFTATPFVLERCAPEQIQAAFAALPSYTPAPGAFVGVADGGFAAGGVRFPVRGANYYPVHTPWRRFLTETAPEAVQREFALMREAGLNTLRIFLWYEALFQCPGSGAVPRPDTFARLDAFIHRAGEAGFRLIVTLNDLPDLEHCPLYTAPAHTQAQTRYIVSRYRDEPVIMAWDLRNEGDIDYRERFTREQVLAWLAETAALVRRIDPNHLMTAGWLQDSAATAPHVDFLSFHHWRSAAELTDRLRALRAATDKPLLLGEVGYSALGRSEVEQAALLDQAIAAAEAEGAAGWLVWTAFDFTRAATCWPGPCLSPNNQEHYFGLWHVEYNPKPAVDVVLRYTGGP
ncbi:MAG: cellulase family glycosylhydrolase [Anaerolineae bacterium]|nr:cellulase family glycosylhydrolase [Anaerolineae bacterium]